MEDDDYPNFGNAYPAQQIVPSATEEQASWNPALRPNAHRRNESRVTNGDDDFFDRYPGPTPEKPRRSQPEDDETEIVSQERQPSPLSHHAVMEDEDGIEDEDEEPELDIQLRQAQPATLPSIEPSAAKYEHQSSVTALDEAIDESVQAPLVEDEQPAPTISTITREGTFSEELDVPEIRNVTRSFTTNFTEIPVVTSTVPEPVKVSSEWPAVGDDKTFAELLDGEEGSGSAAAAPSDEVKGPETAVAEQPVEEDLSAAWAAALDDDDILDDNEMDPTTFFGDDDDGFLLEDDEPTAAPAPAVRPVQQQRAASAYVPSTAPSPFIDQSHGRGVGTPSTGLYDVYNHQQPIANQPVRPNLTSTESFADKGKNGYQSPYDLPMDVVKTRKRPAIAQSMTSTAALPGAPPRTSSFGTPMPAPSPPNSSHGLPNGSATAPTSVRSTPQSNSGFFEDLPINAKPRARPSGMYTPSLGSMPTPPLGPSQPQFPPQQAPPPAVRPASRSSQQYAPQHAQANVAGGFRQPERAPLFPEQITPPSTMQSQVLQSPPKEISNRYSPAPQAVPNTTRYSPAPPGQPKTTQRYSSSPGSMPSLPPSRTSQSFIPRTSSPLAVHGRPQQAESAEQLRSLSTMLPNSPGKAFDTNAHRQGSATARYANSSASTDAGSLPAFSPQRQRTQSPSEFKKLPAIGQAPSISLLGGTPVTAPMRLTHRRQFSRDLPYAAPQNEHAHDPLERWKGHPIFHWSETGMVVSSIPKHTPFYASGTAPLLKCTSGDVKTMDAHIVLPIEEHDAKFPGPISARSKGKKKDLLSWLSLKIEDLQRSVEASTLDFTQTDLERRGKQEKLLLWQVMRIYLDNDGVLEGTPKIEADVRQLLIPDLAQKSQVMDLQSPVSGGTTGEIVDSTAIYQIRQALFEGQRERAVLLAEEKRLWGHAMLIASTVGPESFRQIVSSFVRNQVKSSGNSELKSLSALYQVFAGNPEDCVDELVPPSARAGFHMISTTDARGSIDNLSGLDQWRDTLSLMHSNPSPSNSASLLAIGKLLSSYGRIEAAHVCFLFARSLAKHSGADDPDADFVLLGADAAKGHVDLDSLMLTEAYEYASSLSAPSTAVHYIPHLQAYKLIHARHLAASGHKLQAQAYCEHIDAAIRSTTRPSGYYHQSFAQELMSFNALLAQSVHSNAAGGKFFSRPAIDKVSSGMGSWFTKFVSGEEGETDSNGSGQGATDAENFGPFGGVTSTVISRNTSAADLQNAAFSPTPLMQPFQPSSLPSRYTPLSQGSGKYAPASAAQFGGSRTSLESDRSMPPPGPIPASEPARSSSGRYAPAPSGQSPALLGVAPAAISRRASNQSLASTGSYEPRPLLAEHDGFGYASPPIESAGETFSPQSAPSEPVTNGIEHGEASGETDPEDGSGYAPPTMAYEPPTYQPWQPEPETEIAEQDDAPKPKKKSFMDDDDDDDYTARAAALKKSTPAAPAASSRDREPDPAVVAAAAADAAREAKGHSQRESGSWFGGWFGKKDPNAPAAGPIKAKLGEENSFYFDKNLNKWVNKKAGSEGATASAPTPPPPRAAATPVGNASAPPSRVASGGGPPSGPPSRAGTPASGPPGAGLPQSAAPASAVPGSMAPPPRPASGMSNASSLDDLLGPPGKKAGGTKNKKKGRYVDVMANAN